MGRAGCTRSAGALLRADRRLVLVPLASVAAVSALAAGAAVAAVSTLAPSTRQYGSAYRTSDFGLPGPTPFAVTTIGPTWTTFAVLLGAYLLGAFVLTFAAAVLAAATHQHLTAEPGAARPPLARAVRTAARRSPQLLAWSTVGGIIGVADLILEQRPMLSTVTRRPTWLSWRRASWLVVPVVVFEGRRPRRALARSNALIDEAWGAGALSRTGLGTATAALLAPAAVAALVAGPAGALGAAVTAALLATAAAVALALSTVTRTAAYLHASGVPAAGFDAGALDRAFVLRRDRRIPDRTVTDQAVTEPAPAPGTAGGTDPVVTPVAA